jgi:hypothetical protein
MRGMMTAHSYEVGRAVGLRLTLDYIEDEGSVSALLERLSGLPLALTQAAAYIGQTAMNVVEYMDYCDSMWQYSVEQQDEYPLQEYAFCSVFQELEEMLRACEEAERGSQQPFTTRELPLCWRSLV